MGMTTFPSKIVEYSIGGLLIFSSRVSDVPYLFTDEEVCFTETAEDVLGNLRGVLADIPGAEVRGRRGREKSLKLFSQEEVGTRLREFLK